MPKVRFVLPEVKSICESRPSHCPYCGGGIFQGHGVVNKPIRDTRLDKVVARRYRCTNCQRTFRHYPLGIDSHNQSQRTRALAAIFWGLGLSHNSISQVLSSLGSSIAKMTSWRDVQEVGVNLRRMPRATGPIAVIGVDETFPKVKGVKMTVGFVIEPDSRELLGIDFLVGQDQTEFLKWLRKYVEELGVKVIVSDDLATYKPVVEELGIEHQVCLAHVKKNVAKRLAKIEEPEDANSPLREEKERLRKLLTELSDDGGKELLEMEFRVKGEPKLKELVVDLNEKWRSLRCYKRIEGVPSTNNPTEQVIGRSKIRYKTIRGYKSVEGMMNGLYLTQWVWMPEEIRDATLLVA
jgi:transposase-like protein